MDEGVIAFRQETLPEVFEEPGKLYPGRSGSPGNAASKTGSWS